MIDDTVVSLLDAFGAVWINSAGERCPAEAVVCRRCEGIIARPAEGDVATLADLAMMCALHQCTSLSTTAGEPS